VDCLTYPEVTMDELSEELLGQLSGRRHPFLGTLELTERCNLSCIHCFINQPAGSREARELELSTAEVQRILDEIAAAGCLYLVLTGGEVLLRPDFQEIYLHAKRKGLLVSFFTNGTLLTRELADLLAEWPPSSVSISLYGTTQETYERVTGVPGSFERCMRGIDLLLERGVRLGLKSVILQTNRHELPAVKAFAAERGLKVHTDALLWPRLNGDEMPAGVRLPVEEVMALERAEPERREEWLAMHDRLGGAMVRSEYVYTCGAGSRSFHVDSAGRLGMCLMARRPAYDLRLGTFRQGWEDFLGELVRSQRQQETACRRCSAGALCIQCPGWSQAVHGDSETPVEAICQMGRLRAAELLGTPADRPAVADAAHRVTTLHRQVEDNR